MTAELHLELKGDKTPEETDCTSLFLTNVVGKIEPEFLDLGQSEIQAVSTFHPCGKDHWQHLGFQLVPGENEMHMDSDLF